jgi:predicted alpha/beta hydrolase family esterase
LVVLEEASKSSCKLQVSLLSGERSPTRISLDRRWHYIEVIHSSEEIQKEAENHMTKQILFIHGAGNQRHPLGSRKLVESLQQQLGSDYEVLAPDMPDPDHPGYQAWRSQIKQELDKLAADVLLIGHSLGGSLLLKYLAEGTYQRPIAGLFLVAVPYWGKQDWELEYRLPDDFASHLPPIRQLFLYHSRHDEAVPFSHLWRYQEQLPQATVRALDGKEHSFTRGLPLLAQDIKQL